MTGPEHVAEAERLLKLAAQRLIEGRFSASERLTDMAQAYIALAQVAAITATKWTERYGENGSYTYPENWDKAFQGGTE